MKLENRIKSLNAILTHKRFFNGDSYHYFSLDGKKCCAIGYAFKAHNVKSDPAVNVINLKKTGISNLLGLNSRERDKIVKLNDAGKIEEMKDYCRELLNQCY